MPEVPDPGEAEDQRAATDGASIRGIQQVEFPQITSITVVRTVADQRLSGRSARPSVFFTVGPCCQTSHHLLLKVDMMVIYSHPPKQQSKEMVAGFSVPAG